MPVLQDARLALRLFRRNPTVTAVALLSIAASTGAVALVFTAIRPVLLEPLPYARAHRLIQIGTHYPKAGEANSDWVFWNDVQAIARDSRTLESAGAYRYAMFTLAGGNGVLPEALYGLRVTANLFPTLGVTPMLGRNISSDEDRPGVSEVIILSYGLWTRRFNSDRSVIGRTIVVNGHNSTVIGVMPAGFDFPMRKSTPVRTPSPYMEFWAPMAVDPRGNQGGLCAVGRLHDDALLADAQHEMAAIGEVLAHQQPATNRDRELRAFSMRDRMLGNARPTLLLLLGVAVLFMLIGCSNVANLLLARGLTRRREWQSASRSGPAEPD